MGSKEEHGTSRNAAIVFQRQIDKIGTSVFRFDKLHENLQDREGYIKRISILPSSPVRGDFLLVATAFYEGEHVVCFQQGFSLEEVLMGFLNRLQNGSLKWKDDEYANK